MAHSDEIKRRARDMSRDGDRLSTIERAVKHMKESMGNQHTPPSFNVGIVGKAAVGSTEAKDLIEEWLGKAWEGIREKIIADLEEEAKRITTRWLT